MSPKCKTWKIDLSTQYIVHTILQAFYCPCAFFGWISLRLFRVRPEVDLDEKFVVSNVITVFASVH